MKFVILVIVLFWLLFCFAIARSAKDGDSLPKPKSRNIDERYKINDDEM